MKIKQPVGRNSCGPGLVALLALLALAATNRPARVPVNLFPPPPENRQPNIILILTDDLGYGDPGCYGQQKIKTPNIDKLAADGMRFTSFYAGSTVCAPSRAALMLGRHTGHLDIRGNANQSLRTNDLTLAKVLKQAGYRTGLIGKWGLATEGSEGLPQNMGFDEFAGYLDNKHAHDYYAPYLWRFDPKTDAKPGLDEKISFLENQDGKQGLYIPDLLTKAATNFVRINKPEPFNKYRPFFLFLAYTAPHANNELGKTSGNGMQVPNDKPYSAEAWPQPEKNKAAMITRLDADIGKLLDKLQQLKIADDTIVIFTSDNGPHAEGGVDPKFFDSAGPFRGHKRDLTEGGIRVPFIIRWPAKIKAGTVNDEPWAQWDLLPTLAEAAHTAPPKNLDGLSLLPTLLGQTQPNRHDFFYWEFHENGFTQAARMGDWKLIRDGLNGKPELYNLKTDPGEAENVAAKNPDVVAKLEKLLKTARTDSPAWPIQKSANKEKPGAPEKAKAAD